MNDASYGMPTTFPPEVNDVSWGMSLPMALVGSLLFRGWNHPSLPSWPTRDQSTSVASAKNVLEDAAAEILVCRLSQSRVTHLTLIPVFLVKAASEAFRGGSPPGATVIVGPRGLFQAPA